jgi:hypothetical protein
MRLTNDWHEWKSANVHKLKHPAGFEEEFVDRILANVPRLSPGDVTAQYEFVDDEGRQRRIDFAIRNATKGYNLMIELDGASKDTDTTKWRDFLERQNYIVLRYDRILRFSNRCMFERPSKVIATISRGLKRSAGPAASNNEYDNELGGEITTIYLGRRYIGPRQCCGDCGSFLRDYWRNPEGTILSSCALCG